MRQRAERCPSPLLCFSIPRHDSHGYTAASAEVSMWKGKKWTREKIKTLTSRLVLGVLDCIVDAPDAQGTAGLKETLVSRCPAVPSRV